VPTFLAAILANALGGMAAGPASARIRAMLNQSGRLGGPRSSGRPAPQTAPPRAELTPRVSYGPPVPAGRPGSAARIASSLAARR